MTLPNTMPPLPELDNESVAHVKSHPGYCVTSSGRLLSCRTAGGFGDWKEITGGLDKDGYRKAILCDGTGGRSHVRIGAVVLEAFRGPRPEGMVVCHRDGNRVNNSIDNLRWATQKENINDKWECGTYQHGDRASRRKLTSESVLTIRRRHESGETIAHLATEYAVHKSTIDAAISKRNWKYT